MRDLGIIDIIYLIVVVLFVVIGVVVLWQKANKKRKQSVDDYLIEREQRKQRFNSSRK
jgi:uncharacterized membrane protein